MPPLRRWLQKINNLCTGLFSLLSHIETSEYREGRTVGGGVGQGAQEHDPQPFWSMFTVAVMRL